MKLGKRLQAIESMVGDHYDSIWDCCCDHGLLGAAILSKYVSTPAARQSVRHIHFVDRVPELIHRLEQKLARFFPKSVHPISRAQWQVHCMDVSHLPLRESPGRQLVIIAGVGGDLMAELVNAIRRNNPAVDVDFLLCPVHHQFTLRQQLIQLDFSLMAETLMVENGRFYEIILVSSIENGKPINPVGDFIWQSDTAEQQKTAASYLDKLLAHYKRMQWQKNNASVQHIIDAYSALLSKAR